MRDQELRSVCKKLRPLIGARADALWHAYLTAETPRAKQEAESLIQLVAVQFLGSSASDTQVLLPPPGPDAASGEFLLGNLGYGARDLYPLFLRRENFIKHLGIFSITGGGKTNVAQLLLLGLLQKDIPFLVVDWKRSYHRLREAPVPKAKNIRVFAVGRRGESAFNWNPLRGPPGVHPKTWLSAVVEALDKSHISGPVAWRTS